MQFVRSLVQREVTFQENQTISSYIGKGVDLLYFTAMIIEVCGLWYLEKLFLCKDGWDTLQAKKNDYDCLIYSGQNQI